MRFAGAGFELAAAIIGFAAVGYWLGGYLGSAVWGVVVGATLGVLGGMYNLIRSTLALSREESSRRDRDRLDGE